MASEREKDWRLVSVKKKLVGTTTIKTTGFFRRWCLNVIPSYKLDNKISNASMCILLVCCISVAYLGFLIINRVIFIMISKQLVFVVNTVNQKYT